MLGVAVGGLSGYEYGEDETLSFGVVTVIYRRIGVCSTDYYVQRGVIHIF